jgi:uncharacterized LabA/DUF88 family protein
MFLGALAWGGDTLAVWHFHSTFPMFKPKTSKIAGIAEGHQKVIAELEKLLQGNVSMYIDAANIRPWSQFLGWHIENKRLKQLLDSFDNIIGCKFYQGTLEGDEKSESETEEIKRCGYTLRTKPVKIMRFSIDASSIPINSPTLLDNFIRRSLLRKFNNETIEYLNTRFAEMNTLGTKVIEDRKCNFDVEIGIDMLLDNEREKLDTFVLWSGDSDFHDPLQKLLQANKKVILFATARRVSRELSELRKQGLMIFDIRKIREFICWNKERISKGDATLAPPSPRVRDLKDRSYCTTSTQPALPPKFAPKWLFHPTPHPPCEVFNRYTTFFSVFPTCRTALSFSGASMRSPLYSSVRLESVL